MTVSPGNLDALVGFTGVEQDLAGASVSSFTTSGSGGSLAVATAQVQVTGVPAFGAGAGSSFTITAVSDANNSLTASLIFNGVAAGSVTVYVVGYTADAFLLSTSTSNQLATALATAQASGSGFSAISNIIGIFSPPMLTTGASVTFAASGTYTGLTSTPTAVNVVATNGTNVPAPINGVTNVLQITPAGPNSTLFLTPGYQSATLTGATPATLIDTTSSTLIASSTGNATLLSAAGTGGADTLLAGSANNVLVAFNASAVESAAGQSGNNLFFGGASPITVLGGNGQDTVVLNSGGQITTGTGGSLIFLNAGPTTINSNGADTIVAGAGPATVNVLGSKGVLDFGGSGSLLFNGGSGASTVVGVTSSATINGGVGGGVFFGGTKGNNVINSGSGPATMIGGGSGDVLTATGTANDIMQASSGSETLNAAGSSGNDALFGGAGSDCLIGGTGANSFTAGPGNMTLVGGGKTDLYVFLAGATSSTQIQGFSVTHDFIKLNGFAAGTAQTALSGAKPLSGGTLLTLSDGTQITLVGVAPGTLSAANFT